MSAVLLDADCAKHVRQVSSCDLCSRYRDCLTKRGERPPAQPRESGSERIVAFTARREYWVDRNGNAWSVNRFSGARIELHPAMHNGQLRICVKGVRGLQGTLARMIYDAFKGPIPENANIGYLDGNPENCALDNLTLIDRTQFKRDNGGKAKARPVVVVDKGGEHLFRSVRAAAKHLSMSYQTLQDWLNRKTGWRSSVPGMKGVKVAYLYEEHAAMYPKFKRYNKKSWGAHPKKEKPA